MFKRWLFLALAAIATSMALACGGGGNEDAAPASGSFPFTIRQSDGVELTLTEAPRRIVSLASHATEIFCTIGAEDQLVAVDRFANCPLGSNRKPQLDSFTPNLEAIAGYAPDLVYVSSDRNDLVQSLRRLGIRVLYLTLPDTLEGVLDHIQTLSRAAGRAQEGERLVASMRERMNAVRAKLADVSEGPRVFHELTDDFYTAAPNSFVGDFYTFLKARNIAAGSATAYPQLSAEVIVARNPEVIVLADEAAGVTPAQVKARPGWSVIDAVRNDRICAVNPDIVSRPGPRIVEALETLAKCLYPTRF
jgi:iron complex transport system substrate-binding protein